MQKSVTNKKFRDPESRINSDDIDACDDSAQLIAWKMNIEAGMVEADNKISAAKGRVASSGEYMDPDKFAALTSYRRVIGYLHQKIMFRERLLKSRQAEIRGDQDAFPRIFMQCAKVLLSAEDYARILTKARELSPDEQA